MASGNRLEAWVGGGLAADLRVRLAVDEDDVGGEVVRPADQRRADAVRVDRHALRLELADALRVESSRGDDLDLLVAGVVERPADLADEHLVDAGRGVVAHLLPER